jgi:hypothetical protein
MHLEGSRTAPICIFDDDDDEETVAVRPWNGSASVNEQDERRALDLIRSLSPLTITDNGGDVYALRSTTPVLIVEDEESERGCPHTASEAEFLPASETKRKRCLVTPNRYRAFRASLYTLFAVIKPKVRRMEFEEVIKFINKDLPGEQQFDQIEAKRVLKYMREKLLDSLCADRVVGVDLAGVKLYA